MIPITESETKLMSSSEDREEQFSLTNQQVFAKFEKRENTYVL